MEVRKQYKGATRVKPRQMVMCYPPQRREREREEKKVGERREGRLRTGDKDTVELDKARSHDDVKPHTMENITTQ